MNSLNRREFAAAGIGLVAIANQATAQNRKGDKLRVGIVGHTGRGNFGHGLDVVWNRIESTAIVGVADADEKGLAKQLKKLGLDKTAGFQDYNEMLSSVRPEFVAVCPRHVDQHHAMIMAAINSGAKGIYVEKPFVRTPREADEVVEACQQHNVKLAVAHRNRYHPVLKTIESIIADNKIGRLLEIRGRGKGDHRGGVEDLWVLGSHVLNLACYFGGNPRTCSAVIMQNGRRATDDDIRAGREGIGKQAGNELHARFVAQNGLVTTFDSIANEETGNHSFALRLIGSKGMINIQCDSNPLAHIRLGNPFQADGVAKSWTPISSAGIGGKEPVKDLHQRVYSHEIPVQQLIDSVKNNTTPLCNEREAAMTVEMICAVMQSHQQGSRAVAFPLPNRDHPFGK